MPKLRYANVEKVGSDGSPGSTTFDGTTPSKIPLDVSAVHVEDMT